MRKFEMEKVVMKDHEMNGLQEWNRANKKNMMS